MSDNEFDDIMKAMPSNISNLDSVYTCFKDEHDKWCDSIKNAYAENDDKGMGELGWVKLPVDADGVPIHVGDVMEWPYGNGEFIVEGIGRDVLFYIDQDSNECEWTAVRNKRHHHYEPTVEDVLQEMLEQAVGYSDAHTTVALNAIAEYSAKLRLAGEDE